MSLQSRINRVIADLEEIGEGASQCDQTEAIEKATEILRNTSWWEMH